MTGLRFAAPVALAFGLGAMALALAWWGLTYWPTYANGYLSGIEAGRCLVSDSSLCRLATSLCGARHAALVAAAYSPLALWAGTATACGGLWAAALRRTASAER